jgi:hypothetical protein
LKLIDTPPLDENDDCVSSGGGGVSDDNEFFLKTMKNLKNTDSLHNSLGGCSIQILKSHRNDIVYLSEINANMSVGCEIMKSFIDCYLTLKSITTNESSSVNNINSNRFIQVEKALNLNVQMIILFKGYTFREKIILLRVYFYLRAFYLKELYNIKLSYPNVNNQNYNNILQSYLVSFISFFI